MHIDMIIRKKTTRIWVIISVCSLGLYITACDNGEFPGNEKETEGVDIRFTASISDSPSSRAANGADILTGTAFPDGTHRFGMFITDKEGAAVATGSNDNMKVILNRATGSDTWDFVDKNDQTLSLKIKHGDFINLVGYSPWTANATATSVPFDLTGDAATWKDLLYLSSPTEEQQVLDANPIELTFSHAYCWVTVKLSKLTDKNEVPVKAVSIEHGYNAQKGVINKGTINPKTGDVINGTPGPITINCATPVSIPLEGGGTSPSEFSFLIPSFMSADINDYDIVIRVTTENNGVTEVLAFPLAKANLNNANANLYGFQKGMHNTYHIIYNNSEMILSLADWQENFIDASTLGGGVSGTPVAVELLPSWGMNALKLDLANHIYHTYLGEVAENNNGKYMTLEVTGKPTLFNGWLPFMKGEAIYPKLMVARNLAMGGAPVPWKDETTGVLTAKQACADLRDGGYRDWRLPRVSELFFFVYQVPDGIKLNADQLWSATEFDADNCYSTNKGNEDQWIFPVKSSKTENLYVRCVRDYNKSNSII